MRVPEFQWHYDDYGNSIKDDKPTMVFSYEAVIPTPKTKEECPDYALLTKGSSVIPDSDKPWLDWYTWNCYNWGVKWDASDPYYDDNREISFESPWGAPSDNVFQAIADKWNVQFSRAADNEDGGWEEVDYIYTPNEPIQTESSEWQIEDNARREKEWEEECDEDDETMPGDSDGEDIKSEE